MLEPERSATDRSPATPPPPPNEEDWLRRYNERPGDTVMSRTAGTR